MLTGSVNQEPLGAKGCVTPNRACDSSSARCHIMVVPSTRCQERNAACEQNNSGETVVSSVKSISRIPPSIASVPCECLASGTFEAVFDILHPSSSIIPSLPSAGSTRRIRVPVGLLMVGSTVPVLGEVLIREREAHLDRVLRRFNEHCGLPPIQVLGIRKCRRGYLEAVADGSFRECEQAG